MKPPESVQTGLVKRGFEELYPAMNNYVYIGEDLKPHTVCALFQIVTYTAQLKN